MKEENEKKFYISPLSSRYASKEMAYIFSEEKKIKTWRLLWISLAKAEKKLGLNITEEQIKDLEKYKDDINFKVAEKKEKEIRHDVMAQIFAYGEQAKIAKPIIHLGATSCYVGDNTDVIVMREGLFLIKEKLITIMKLLYNFCDKYKELATLSYTHLQPAQPTTVGKRGALWLYDIYLDYNDLLYVIDNLKMLGQKGTTGTQASFYELFNKNNNKCKKLEEYIIKDFGFKEAVAVSGQTYTRKQDENVLSLLAKIASSAHKFTNDLRILQHLKEIEEPFEKNQVGSSAMPYKRNPMRCERISSLAKYVITNQMNSYFVHSTQWFERTLDDSANRRIAIAESFLAIDGILNLYINVVDNLVVNEKIIEKNLKKELPFMMTENIMMNEVKKGKDRQVIHEVTRKLSIKAGREIKKEGKENNLLELIAMSKDIDIDKKTLDKLSNPKLYIGRAKEQVEEFLKEYIKPILDKNKKMKKIKVQIEV